MEVALKQKRVSYWSAAWMRFKKNKMAVVGLIYIIAIIIISIFTPWIAPYSYDETHYDHTFEKPSRQFIWGTDDLGRDMFSRNLYAMRNALLIGFGSQIVVVIIGVIIGAIAGFRGGRVDSFLMRVVDIVYAFPTFLFNVILVTVLGRGLFTILVAVGLTGWAGTARLVRGVVMYLKHADFVEAARALGAKESYIIRKYILPNMLGPLIVSVAFGVPNGIWIESGLALIGMGVRPPMPSWGNMIGAGAAYIMAFPHIVIFPVVTFALTLLAFTYVGDGLRDALNPRSEV
ncbi:MAG: ABC transporter permease [Dictyoglomaceae bacterium]|nr:ABC transporter permease [Dictyoglomaceae bacterium]HPU43566.1 ABC transporter permease [Dictyoglomaceae bacterium]